MAEQDPQAQAKHVAKVIEQMQKLGGLMEELKTVQASRSGLPLAAFNLLSCVAGFGRTGCTVSQAAALLGVRPQALNTPAGRLAKDSLLIRQVDEADSRARRLVATREGAERLEIGRAVLEDLAQAISRQIPAANVAQLFLSRLLDGAQTVLKAERPPSGKV